MKKIFYLLVLCLLWAFVPNVQAAFVPTAGIKYYIMQTALTSSKVVGASTSTQPAVMDADKVSSQTFEFIPVSGKTDVYYLKNDDGLYLNNINGATGLVYESAVNATNGLCSEWTLEGSAISAIRLKVGSVATNNYLTSSAVTSGSILTATGTASDTNSAFKLIAATDLIQNNVIDGGFENALNGGAPLGTWTSLPARILGNGGSNSRVNNTVANASTGTNSFLIRFWTDGTSYNKISYKLTSLVTAGKTYKLSFNYRQNTVTTLTVGPIVNAYITTSANDTTLNAISPIDTTTVPATTTTTISNKLIFTTPSSGDCYLVFAKAGDPLQLYLDDLTLIENVPSINPSIPSLALNADKRSAGVNILGNLLTDNIEIEVPAGITASKTELLSGANEIVTFTYSDYHTTIPTGSLIKLKSGSIKTDIPVTASFLESIKTSVNNLSFGTYSRTATITVNANIIDPAVTTSITAPDGITLSASTFSTTAPTTITVTYAGNTSVTGNITFTAGSIVISIPVVATYTAPFVPESGAKYYIMQTTSNRAIGANSTASPVVMNVDKVSSQIFTFVSETSGKVDTYYLKNDAGMYLNKLSGSNWTTSFETAINGTSSEWLINGFTADSIRLKVGASAYLASDAITDLSLLYCDKTNTNANGQFKLVKVTDLVQNNIMDGGFEYAAIDGAPFGKWISSPARTLGGSSNSRVTNSYQSTGAKSFLVRFNGDAASYASISHKLTALIPGAQYRLNFNYKQDGSNAATATTNVYVALTANVDSTAALVGSTTLFKTTPPADLTPSQPVLTGTIIFVAPADSCYLVFEKTADAITASTNFNLYLDDLTLKATTVTIEYQDQSGKSIQPDRVVTADLTVGATYKALASDKAGITVGDVNYVYDVTSIDTVVVAEGNSTIILKFSVAPKVTIKYQDQSGNSIQPDRIVSTDLIAGATYTALASDKAGITVGDVNYAYDVTSVDTVVVIAGNANIVLKFVAPTVTVKYQDQSGNSIQPDRVVSTDLTAGTTYTALTSDKADITVNGSLYNYDTTSTDNVVVVAGNANIVLKFTKLITAINNSQLINNIYCSDKKIIIDFDLPATSAVEFSIYNTQGALLSKEEATFESGRNHKVINANLPSGVYLVKVVQNGQSITKEVIL